MAKARTPFESQCDKISEELDKLSDWEVRFYLYCLLPKYADDLETYMKEMKLRSGYDYLAKEAVRRDISTLRRMRESLVHDLF